MADEVNLAFVASGTDADLHQQWRARPPDFLEPDGYKLFDESYDTLVFRANVSTVTMKLLTWGWGKTSTPCRSPSARPRGRDPHHRDRTGLRADPRRLAQYAVTHQRRNWRGDTLRCR